MRRRRHPAIDYVILRTFVLGRSRQDACHALGLSAARGFQIWDRFERRFTGWMRPGWPLKPQLDQAMPKSDAVDVWLETEVLRGLWLGCRAYGIRGVRISYDPEGRPSLGLDLRRRRFRRPSGAR